MSKVYGFCDAGCRYRVTPYDDFIKSASIVKITAEDNFFDLEAGKTYSIKEPQRVANSWGHSTELYGVVYTSESVHIPTIVYFDLPEYDKYANDTLKVKYLGFEGSASTNYYRFVYEINGVRYTAQQSKEAGGEIFDVKVNFAGTENCEVYLFNEDAKVEALLSLGEAALLSDAERAAIAQLVIEEGFYTKEQIDGMFESYINEIDTLIGGD